eukprot:gene32381-41952_t
MKRSSFYMRSIPGTYNSAYSLAISSSIGGSNLNIRMPSVILVNPFSPANIGSISRVMLNFGLTDLRVVSPECDILSEEARTLAVGSFEVLQNAVVYNSLEESLADLNKVIVTSARPRNLNQVVLYYYIFQTIGDISEGVWDSKVGIVFGRERNGLTTEEIALGDLRVVIPAFEEYDVLNLAQAVNIIAYEFWQRKLELESEANSGTTSVSPPITSLLGSGFGTADQRRGEFAVRGFEILGGRL